LVRYVIDRYASSDSAFFQTLINANLSGVANLQADAGAAIEEMLEGWGLALYADDYPGLTPMADVATRFPTWNLRSIYAGLNSSPEWTARWPTPYPVTPVQLAPGSFEASSGGIRGGGHAYFELTGSATEPQLLRLQLTPGVRAVVLRLQ
jgi:hypothetical protein